MIRSSTTLAASRRLAPILGLLMSGADAAEKSWWDYPENVKVIEMKGDARDFKVTKSTRLPETYVPGDLMLIKPEIIRTNKPVEVKRELLNPLKELRLAAEKDGIDLVVLSGYRSFKRQRKVYLYWVDKEKGDRDAADRYSARAGHSEHQLGTVVDFSTNEINDAIGSQFHGTRAARWLNKNASKHGFQLSYAEGKETETGYQWESWHWRWWPVKE